jgi:GNAT superfamily N-acetyltransferase
MGKAEGPGENWHGHVTAVTVREANCLKQAVAADPLALSAQVAPEYRRQGLAQKLMGLLEETTIKR